VPDQSLRYAHLAAENQYLRARLDAALADNQLLLLRLQLAAYHVAPDPTPRPRPRQLRANPGLDIPVPRRAEG
jgi:hypothetical protein